MRSLTDKDYNILPNRPISNSRIRVSHVPTLRRRTLSQQGKDGRHPYLVPAGFRCDVAKIRARRKKRAQWRLRKRSYGRIKNLEIPLKFHSPDLSAALRQDGKCLNLGST